jgi:hypothetical protein
MNTIGFTKPKGSEQSIKISMSSRTPQVYKAKRLVINMDKPS